MPTEVDPKVQRQALERQLGRMTDSLEQLTARIARLAQNLDVSLSNDAEVERVLSRQLTTSSPREQRMANELRALLVLRYGMACRCVKEVGVKGTKSIITYTEEHLVHVGYTNVASSGLRQLCEA